MTIDLTVYTTGGTRVGTASTAQLVSTKVRIGEPGATVVNVPDGSASLFVRDRVLRVESSGTILAAGLIRDRQLTIDENYPAGMRTYTMPGTMQVLADGLQYPPGGVTSNVNVREVTYGWPHPDYDYSAHAVPASWGTQQSDPWGDLRPDDWPDGSAQFIAGSATNVTSGDDYLFTEFTVAATADVGIWVTSDDYYDLYFEGGLIGQSRVLYGWRGRDFYRYTLPAGTYRLAAKIHNLPRAGANPNWLLATIGTLDSSGNLDTVLRRTDTTNWKVLSRPASPPGMTVGEILRIAVEAAQARGTTLLDDVTFGFSDTLDSDGGAWSAELVLPVRVGETILSIATTMRGHGVSVWMDADLTLQAREGAGQDLTATVDVGAGGDGSTWKQLGEAATVVLGATANGWVEEISTGTRYERFQDLTAYLEGEHAQVTDQTLEDWAVDAETASFVLDFETGSAVPVSDFGLGDLISGDDIDGNTASWLVGGWSLTPLDEDHFVWRTDGVKQ